MNPGLLRHKIVIQYNVAEGQTESGFPSEDWQPLAMVWAKRSGLKGRLFYQAAAAQTESDVVFTIRYREGIQAGMRIVQGTETFEIKVPPVDTDGTKRWLELYTRQVLPSGN